MLMWGIVCRGPGSQAMYNCRPSLFAAEHEWVTPTAATLSYSTQTTILGMVCCARPQALPWHPRTRVQQICKHCILISALWACKLQHSNYASRHYPEKRPQNSCCASFNYPIPQIHRLCATHILLELLNKFPSPEPCSAEGVASDMDAEHAPHSIPLWALLRCIWATVLEMQQLG